MRLVSVNCPNCGSPINIDLDNMARYCGTCGSKIMLDVETIQTLLIEKEKTRQTEIVQESKSNNLYTIMAMVIGTIVAIGSVLILIIDKIADKIG